VEDTVKLSSPETSEFWKIPILFEDEHVLALNKPSGLQVSPDPAAPERANLLGLLHRGIAQKAPWAAERNLTYLTQTHRLDSDASGVLVLAKDKGALTSLAAQFTTAEPRRFFVALARGEPSSDTFDLEAKLATNPLQMGMFKIDNKRGKRSRTFFSVRERFRGFVLLDCKPLPGRLCQVQVHLQQLRLPMVGAAHYGGRPLFLSTLKSDYQLKRGETERPLLGRAALHAAKVIFDAVTGGARVTVEAPWPKDLNASVKYLRRYAL
jgi:RluA family pseudouridine synthase